MSIVTSVSSAATASPGKRPGVFGGIGGGQSFPEPVFDSGTHTTWQDLRSNGAGSLGSVPGNELGSGNTHGDVLYGVNNGSPNGYDYVTTRYFADACLDDPVADADAGWGGGGLRPDTDIPNVRTMISSWYFRPENGYQWNSTFHGVCGGGSDQKFFLSWREDQGGSGQRHTTSARSSGDTTQTEAWGYTPARDFSPGGFACDWTLNFSGTLVVMSYMNYGEAGGASVHPYQINDGTWHRVTIEIRRETGASTGNGDGLVGMWIDGNCVAWYDGEDSGRPEFGGVTTNTNRFGYAHHFLGIYNRGAFQQQDIDLAEWHSYYPTAEDT